MLDKSNGFIPLGHCYLWIPGLLWMHVIADLLIGIACLGIALVLCLLVRTIRLPFSPVFIVFGLFIGLCGLTHVMAVWNVWHPDYWSAGLLKVAAATASLITAIGLFRIKPQIEEVVCTARLSEERRIRLESSNAEREALYARVRELDELKTRLFSDVSHDLRMPLSAPDGARHTPLRDLPGRPHVLVVADDPGMRALVAATLNADYNIVTAADGREGLDRAQALRPDLIVADVMLPRMSGDQLVAAVRACRDFDSMPVLLLTAQADDGLRVKLLQDGTQDYLTKPFLPQELRVRAARLIAMKRAGDMLQQNLASRSLDLEGMAKEIGIRHRQLKAALDAAEAAREQAERAHQIKSHFLAMVAHELRKPLSIILMNLQQLAHGQADAATDPLPERLARTVKAAQQMNTLIEGLLEYTRVEGGRIDARREAVDAVELAGEVIDAHRDSVAPGVRLILLPSAHHLPAVVSDARLLRVVLNNLLSNALKFTKQGTVTLRVGSAGVGHVFEVHDTGIGIPAADIPRIFLPFEQLEPVQRTSIPGAGLGLALAKRIVEAMHGRLDVTSTVGAGSSFTVWVPGDITRAAES